MLLWTYLIRSFMRVFLVCMSSFIAILLVTRMKEIARFAALGSSFMSTFYFILYQIPHILPMAIPISSLISAFLLFQKMSRSKELTALRSCALSLRVIVGPVLVLALLISIGNFLICSEVATTCRQKARKMLFDETSVNPLVLLQRQKLLKIKESFIDMEIDEGERSAQNILFIAPNRSNNHLSLISADRFSLDGDLLIGEEVSLISHIGSEKEDAFNTLVIENQSKMSTDASSVSNVMKKSRFRLNPSSLPMKYVLAKAQSKKEDFFYALVEVVRRISLGLSAFTLTFIGAAFGIEISRTRSRRGSLIAFLLSALLLTAYLYGKSVKSKPAVSLSLFLLPHLCIYVLGMYRLRSLSRGIE